ncbi:STAS domain-containing protein [Neptuniibacter sp.]|uniref:STAS domain-containing protein n=1 Tax=Neptuniibacter sp. TaxID=1962643 RepID=UPI002604A77B|nr:STAS domain-containing protein [Neptuniibacter sp.]MCP4598566.1 STAS domain-containing protein [Neptuniibacter sp.]
MSAKAEITSEGVIGLSGELKFPVIMQMRKQLEGMLKGVSGSIVVDFSAVSAVDSSALSLWMCCLRYADSVGAELEPRNVPQEMMSFASLVGLDNQLT